MLPPDILRLVVVLLLSDVTGGSLGAQADSIAGQRYEPGTVNHLSQTCKALHQAVRSILRPVCLPDPGRYHAAEPANIAALTHYVTKATPPLTPPTVLCIACPYCRRLVAVQQLNPPSRSPQGSPVAGGGQGGRSPLAGYLEQAIGHPCHKLDRHGIDHLITFTNQSLYVYAGPAGAYIPSSPLQPDTHKHMTYLANKYPKIDPRLKSIST